MQAYNFDLWTSRASARESAPDAVLARCACGTPVVLQDGDNYAECDSCFLYAVEYAALQDDDDDYDYCDDDRYCLSNAGDDYEPWCAMPVAGCLCGGCENTRFHDAEELILSINSEMYISVFDR